MSDDIGSKEKVVTTEEVVENAVNLFFSADKSISSTSLSRGSVIRAFRFAMHSNLTTKDVKLQSEDEIKLAFVFKTMLESRLIMQAKLVTDSETNKNQGEEENVQNNT